MGRRVPPYPSVTAGPIDPYRVGGGLSVEPRHRGGLCSVGVLGTDPVIVSGAGDRRLRGPVPFSRGRSLSWVACVSKAVVLGRPETETSTQKGVMTGGPSRVGARTGPPRLRDLPWSESQRLLYTTDGGDTSPVDGVGPGPTRWECRDGRT